MFLVFKERCFFSVRGAGLLEFTVCAAFCPLPGCRVCPLLGATGFVFAGLER